MDNHDKLILVSQGKLPESALYEVIVDISKRISHALSPVDELTVPFILIILGKYIECFEKRYPHIARYVAIIKECEDYKNFIHIDISDETPDE